MPPAHTERKTRMLHQPENEALSDEQLEQIVGGQFVGQSGFRPEHIAARLDGLGSQLGIHPEHIANIKANLHTLSGFGNRPLTGQQIQQAVTMGLNNSRIR
jgi:hypothetical protein